MARTPKKDQIATLLEHTLRRIGKIGKILPKVEKDILDPATLANMNLEQKKAFARFLTNYTSHSLEQAARMATMLNDPSNTPLAVLEKYKQSVEMAGGRREVSTEAKEIVRAALTMIMQENLEGYEDEDYPAYHRLRVRKPRSVEF